MSGMLWDEDRAVGSKAFYVVQRADSVIWSNRTRGFVRAAIDTMDALGRERESNGSIHVGSRRW